jgi:hypothetical protein
VDQTQDISLEGWDIEGTLRNQGQEMSAGDGYAAAVGAD